MNPKRRAKIKQLVKEGLSPHDAYIRVRELEKGRVVRMEKRDPPKN